MMLWIILNYLGAVGQKHLFVRGTASDEGSSIYFNVFGV